MNDYKLIGKDFTPPDLVAKVTGKAKFAEDFKVEGMVFCRLLVSPMPHGKVNSIDATEALAMPGVIGILTADDLPPTTSPNKPILTNEPHYVGEPILALAAESETQGRQCLGTPISPPQPCVISTPLTAGTSFRISFATFCTAADAELITDLRLEPK